MQNVAIKLGKFILIAPVLSILLYSACGSFNLDVTLKSEKQIDQRYYYFNDSLFRDVDTSLTNYRISLDYFYLDHISGLLRRYSEESFYYDSLGINALRFLVSRSFQEPYLLRVENHDGKVILYWQEIKWAFPGNLETITDEESTELSIDYWHEMLSVLEEMGFWNLKNWSQQHYPLGDFLEARYDGLHHATTSSSFDPECKNKLNLIIDYLSSRTNLEQTSRLERSQKRVNEMMR
tara:strand:- start:150440 stop:151147 length:708 start_codon:yes stop_codon:yes gene_type:complete